MKRFKLLRVAYRLDGTFGVFFDVLDKEELPFALTCERVWLDNKKQESCIPSNAIYVCKRVKSPKFGDTFEVTGVPNRSNILLHRGNIDDNSLGCILIGEQFSVWQDNSCAITSSDAGFKEFMQRTIAINEFELEIKDVK